MKMEEKIEFIDEFLATCEDWMHGKEGDDVTKCRKYLAEVGAELKKLRVADVIKNEVAVCDCEVKGAYEEWNVHICKKCDKERI
jgi:hypothetical protein